MKVSPQWLRELVPGIKVDDRKLADELTLAGIAVEAHGQSATGVAIFEMEITTNRVDAMNHYGIGREMSAIYDLDLPPITVKLSAAKGKNTISVEITVPEQCARFTGQEIRGVKIGPSQKRVQEKFAALDQKPINNAADATNYVMLLMGKPTHAFDADKLAGGRIIVRMAKPGETLKTLDGVERKLHPEDVVVADAEKPVALAGVIGGWDTMITEATKNVFIESAWWDPASVRRTSRRHAIHTDASHRFERGADWASCPLSTDLVAQLILESAGGELGGPQVDVIARNVGHAPVALSRTEVVRILGKDITTDEVERILRRLGFALTAAARTTGVAQSATRTALVEDVADYTVAIPTWRLDVEREIDLIEEIARIHGFNKFADTLPGFSGAVMKQPHAAKEMKLRSTLLALGYNEALSSTFIAQEASLAFSTDKVVEIANPLSEEASAMRTSLLPGMFAMLTRNLNRGNENVRLFEAGHIYAMAGADSTSEKRSVALGMTVATALAPASGAWVNAGVKQESAADAAFFALKGDIEAVLAAFQGEVSCDRSVPNWFDRGVSARVLLNGAVVAQFGGLSSSHKHNDQLLMAEIFVEKLFESELRVPRYQPISRYPAVDRDFSFLLPNSVTWERVQNAIGALQLYALQRLEPAEIFHPKDAGDSYSMLLCAVFQSNERTLRDDEVALWSAQIVEALKVLGGMQR